MPFRRGLDLPRGSVQRVVQLVVLRTGDGDVGKPPCSPSEHSSISSSLESVIHGKRCGNRPPSPWRRPEMSRSVGVSAVAFLPTSMPPAIKLRRYFRCGPRCVRRIATGNAPAHSRKDLSIQLAGHSAASINCFLLALPRGSMPAKLDQRVMYRVVHIARQIHEALEAHVGAVVIAVAVNIGDMQFLHQFADTGAGENHIRLDQSMISKNSSSLPSSM